MNRYRLRKYVKLKNCILIITSIFLLKLSGMESNAVDILSAKPADYSKRLIIWEKPVGYSKKSKLESMKIDRITVKPSFSFSNTIVGEKYKDVEEAVDTFTYYNEIKPGYESDSFDDKPYLIPYIAKDSDKAVIIIPGGGFVFKTIDGSGQEGKDVARKLQERGINAFVLHYRSNPYKYPIPQLDLQRAIRYLRHNSEKYGIDKRKIGILGYSAGGGLVGQHINKVQGSNLFPNDYYEDDIDQEDDRVKEAGMIYPVLTYKYNVPMLFSSYKADSVRDSKKREFILKDLDLSKNIKSKSVKQFISYGTSDKIVNPTGTQEYISSLVRKGGSVNIVVADGKGHGYGQDYYMYDYITWILTTWRKLK